MKKIQEPGTKNQEKPILFSTPMIKAILDGSKTQTRRILKSGFEHHSLPFSKILFHPSPKLQTQAFFRDKGNLLLGTKCPYGNVGDLIWVRETFIEFPHGVFNFKTDPDPVFEVAASKWKPSIHMPKSAARIWLEIEKITVERLQDISEEDARSEGVITYMKWLQETSKNYNPDTKLGAYPVTAFSRLWKKINGRESWKANPWVWVVKYKILSTTGKPQECYKSGELCKYDCKGLCRESM